MRIFYVLTLGCCALLWQGNAMATQIQSKTFEDYSFVTLKHNDHHNYTHFASAGFSTISGPSSWYTITTNSYPDVTPLSIGRNKGISKGRVYLSPTGVTIGEAGDYWVDISAVLQNPGEDSLLVPVFLVIDETFVPDDPTQIGAVDVLQPNVLLQTLNGSGILKDVPEGARLSLVATNGGYPESKDVVVAAWGITVYKLP